MLIVIIRCMYYLPIKNIFLHFIKGGKKRKKKILEKGEFDDPGAFRLVAFNLGFLPGGDKEIITKPETTLPALEAAKKILMPGGLISLVVYVGHPGGW